MASVPSIRFHDGPIETSPDCTPVQISVLNNGNDRFEKAPNNEARIQLLLKLVDARKQLRTEALQSDNPLRNLANAAEPWVFPSGKHTPNDDIILDAPNTNVH